MNDPFWYFFAIGWIAATVIFLIMLEEDEAND